jgi:hypothetical protein
MLENIERAIKNGQPKETGNIAKPIQKHNTMGLGHHQSGKQKTVSRITDNAMAKR